MPYTLKESDGSHTQIGVANGARQNQGATFWVLGWSDAARRAVAVGGSYILVFPDGHANSVEVVEIGGAGKGGIRFQMTG